MITPSEGKHIPHFSNPRVTFMGKQTGVENSADNARMINSTGCIVANFREEPFVSLSGSIIGPFAVCIGESVPVSAFINGGANGQYTFEWAYSYDGFNFTIFSNQASTNIPGRNLPPTNNDSHPIYIRLIVSDQNGNSISLNKIVIETNQPAGQNNDCPKYSNFVMKDLKNSSNNKYHPEVVLSPNPVLNEVNILIPENIGAMNIEIYSVQGQILIMKPLNFSNTDNQNSVITLNTSTLPSGIFLLKIIGRDNSFIKQFIKY